MGHQSITAQKALAILWNGHLANRSTRVSSPPHTHFLRFKLETQFHCPPSFSPYQVTDSHVGLYTIQVEAVVSATTNNPSTPAQLLATQRIDEEVSATGVESREGAVDNAAGCNCLTDQETDEDGDVLIAPVDAAETGPAKGSGRESVGASRKPTIKVLKAITTAGSYVLHLNIKARAWVFCIFVFPTLPWPALSPTDPDQGTPTPRDFLCQKKPPSIWGLTGFEYLQG